MRAIQTTVPEGSRNRPIIHSHGPDRTVASREGGIDIDLFTVYPADLIDKYCSEIQQKEQSNLRSIHDTEIIRDPR